MTARASRIFLLLTIFAFVATSCAPLVDHPGWRPVSMPGPGATRPIPNMPTRLVSFETDEGTNLNVDVSPDGETLVFDLLGDIYLLPINGGEVILLTTGMAWDQAPRFSPDGKSVHFVSDRKDYKNIWRVTLADKSVHQVTMFGSNIMGTPNWSQDGTRLIATQSDAMVGFETVLQSIDPATSDATSLEDVDGAWVDWDAVKILRDQVATFSGVQAAGGEVYVAEAKPNADYSKTSVRIYKIDPVTRERSFVTPADAPYNEFKPQLSHDGKLLAYFRQYPDRRTELRVLHRNTGEDRTLFQLTDADDGAYYASHELWPNYAFTPDDQQIVFWQSGKIHRVALKDGVSAIIPFRVKVEREVWARALPSIQKIADIGEAQITRWPSLSDDGETMIFAAIGYIWIMDMQIGHIRRLTDGTDFEYMPALSPDGQLVAYSSFAQLDEGYGPARLMIANVDNGTLREIIAGANNTYFLPNWSQDGQRIALIREAQTDTGVEAAIGWISLTSSEFHRVAKAPASNVFYAKDIFSRFVSFDEAGERLLYSYPSSGKEMVLFASDLDGDNHQALAIGAPDIGGITPAPNLQHLT